MGRRTCDDNRTRRDRCISASTLSINYGLDAGNCAAIPARLNGSTDWATVRRTRSPLAGLA